MLDPLAELAASNPLLGVLLPTFRISRTRRFGTIAQVPLESWPQQRSVHVSLNCDYTRAIVESAIARRPWCKLAPTLAEAEALAKLQPPLRAANTTSPVEAAASAAAQAASVLQFADFENIYWESVLSGQHGAASYLVRKGLSRKAQLALQIRRYLSKQQTRKSTSILEKAVPYTLILDTWSAHEELKMDFGGGTFASFDVSGAGSGLALRASLRQRLLWCLEDTQEEVERPERQGWLWILKPSVTNKGADISLHRDWPSILDCLEDKPDIREWVLQRYIANPLLIRAHKFHLRVYVLCVGALRVYCFDQILMLLAARRYDNADLDDVYRHLTNTARGAETDGFDEERFVKVLDDLPFYVPFPANPVPATAATTTTAAAAAATAPDAENGTETDSAATTNDTDTASTATVTATATSRNTRQAHKTSSSSSSSSGSSSSTARTSSVALIRQQVHAITRDLFAAYENEYTVFAPMPHCFELFGLDFVVDQGLGVHLLEVNPGPDFKQTGDRLRRLIVDLWEGTCSLVLDGQAEAPHFTRVYDQEWSAARIQGGLSFQED